MISGSVLDLAFGHLLEHVLEFGGLLLGQFDVAELALAEQGDLTRLALVNPITMTSSHQRPAHRTGPGSRPESTGPQSRSTSRSRPAWRVPDQTQRPQEHIATAKRSRQHQYRRHRSLALVESRLDNDALGRCITRCHQFQHLGLQQHLLQQDCQYPGRSWPRLPTNGESPPYSSGTTSLGHEFLLDPLEVGLGLVDFGDRHDHRHIGRLRVVNGLGSAA
jgi:hypothetical protein